MPLTLEFVRNNRPVDSGSLRNACHFFGHELYELNNRHFYLRRDYHFISTIGRPQIDIYHPDQVFAYFPNQNLQTHVERVDMIRSETVVNDFTGFEPGRRFRLQNGQVWEQVGGITSDCGPGGTVLIKDRQLMQIGNWNWQIRVRQIS